MGSGMNFSDLNVTYKTDIVPIVAACLKENSEDEFKKILKNTERVIGQKMSVCGIAARHADAMKTISNMNTGFPEKFILNKINAYERVKLPLLRCWLKQQSPQILELNNNMGTCSTAESFLTEKDSIHNVISHGVLDVGQNYVSYFDFIDIPEKIKACHVTLVEILVPHLHIAYTKLSSVKKSLTLTLDKLPVAPKASDDERPLLSPKEYEVLSRLSEGKSNRDIGDTLNISEFTVKTHVQHIIKKMNATNRQHAVAKALELKLIYL